MKQDPTKSARGRDVIESHLHGDVMDLAMPIEAIDAELRQLGLDPDRIARAARWGPDAARRTEAEKEVAGEDATLIRFPSWVRDWQVHHAAAAAPSGLPAEPFEIDLSGSPGPHRVSLDLQPVYDGVGDGMLIVEWSVDAFHAAGWELLLYTGPDEPPTVVFLGEEPSGRIVLTRDRLGFDPVAKAIGYVFAARKSSEHDA